MEQLLSKPETYHPDRIRVTDALWRLHYPLSYPFRTFSFTPPGLLQAKYDICASYNLRCAMVPVVLFALAFSAAVGLPVH
jgi:hypothetical protein